MRKFVAFFVVLVASLAMATPANAVGRPPHGCPGSDETGYLPCATPAASAVQPTHSPVCRKAGRKTHHGRACGVHNHF